MLLFYYALISWFCFPFTKYVITILSASLTPWCSSSISVPASLSACLALHLPTNSSAKIILTVSSTSTLPCSYFSLVSQACRWLFFLLIPDQLNYCTFKSITYSKPIFCPAQKDINSKIVEKGKIMNLLNCFRSPVMNQNRFKDFCVRF